ncbi:sortase B [Breznakia sp. PF5-3]|uniref:class B sortase n=1 Tax=unclassified Breznakia TaxID=2623764 RepID=UPI0024070A55|nr:MULTISPECIES: class B sortase [unclassified Breznakia]MDL2276747.1 class B sortase [Breznakia sp. OttesenSCG-928-G09]MDF9825291.1 sortase B [Breznakia sp. PM6-1]MDF9836163.1 sortase B [Breznakia sp. PF5-3]MDF9837391.1 sortase B [Breznakia sp. PFB2-8]MDF9859326.1 sortase B [Breznakia sp. PH5-24]
MKQRKQLFVEKKQSKRFIERKIIKGIHGIINASIFVVLLLLFIYGCYALWDSKQVTNEAQAIQYEAYKPSEEDNLSFQELQTINDEVFGWLTVYGTRIDYPFVQAEDNKKYVNTDSKGKYSISGSIFLDSRNKHDFSDFNSILFGHHMVESAMFGDLSNFTDSMYFKDRKYGNIYYSGKNHGIEFFAFLETDSYDSVIFQPAIINDDQRQAALEYIEVNALHYRDLHVTTKDHIVILSTCSSALTNGRYILVGRITDSTYPDSFNRAKDNLSESNVGIWNTFLRLPLWAKLVLGILLLCIVWMIIEKSRKGNGDENSSGNKKDTV